MSGPVISFQGINLDISKLKGLKCSFQETSLVLEMVDFCGKVVLSPGNETDSSNVTQNEAEKTGTGPSPQQESSKHKGKEKVDEAASGTTTGGRKVSKNSKQVSAKAVGATKKNSESQKRKREDLPQTEVLNALIGLVSPRTTKGSGNAVAKTESKGADNIQGGLGKKRGKYKKKNKKVVDSNPGPPRKRGRPRKTENLAMASGMVSGPEKAVVISDPQKAVAVSDPHSHTRTNFINRYRRSCFVCRKLGRYKAPIADATGNIPEEPRKLYPRCRSGCKVCNVGLCSKGDCWEVHHNSNPRRQNGNTDNWA